MLVAAAAPISMRLPTQLERQNVIDSPLVFTTAVRFFYKAEDQLKAGEYLFQPASAWSRCWTTCCPGRSVLHAITFPEGLTSQQIVDRLNAEPVLTGDDRRGAAGRRR